MLRLDNRDVGLSTKFDVGYTLEAMAEDVRLLLDELHIDSAHVVGTSMGGWIAQKLAYIEHARHLATIIGSPGTDLPAPSGANFRSALPASTSITR